MQGHNAGARTGLYSTFTALQRGAICFGPLGAALLFWWSGNVWRVPVIEEIMLVGVALSAVSILPMFMFNDDKTLGIDSEAYQELMALEGVFCELMRYPHFWACNISVFL